MVSRNTRIKIILIALAMLVLLIPFMYPTCRVEKDQLHVSISSTKWIMSPQGGVLTMKIGIENGAGCDASVESLQFRIYRLIYLDNSTEDVDLPDAQVIHATIPTGGMIETNFAFNQTFTVGPRTVLAKITVILGDGSSLEVFDGPIDTTTAEESS